MDSRFGLVSVLLHQNLVAQVDSECANTLVIAIGTARYMSPDILSRPMNSKSIYVGHDAVLVFYEVA